MARPLRAGSCLTRSGACGTRLSARDDGDRQFVKVLAAVLEDGLEAVEAACAEALDSGACSADVVLNILAMRYWGAGRCAFLPTASKTRSSSGTVGRLWNMSSNPVCPVLTKRLSGQMQSSKAIPRNRR